MTFKKMILVVAVLLMVATVTMSATAQESWQHVDSSSVSPKNTQTSTLTVVAAGNIPRHTDVFGGFAWIYADGPNTAIVAATHDGVRDSLQNPDGWHAHNVQLGGTGANSDLCITGVFDVKAGLSIHGDTLSMQVRNSDLTGTLSNTAVAFTIVPDSDCSSGLGVTLS
jgi:hypothetical protein